VRRGSERSERVNYIDTNNYQYQYALKMVISFKTSVVPTVPVNAVHTISTKRCDAVPYYVHTDETRNDAQD